MGQTLKEKLKNIARVGWMDSISYQHELGEASKGNKIYPTKKDCHSAHPCIETGRLDDPYTCQAIKVYVISEDAIERIKE